MQSIVEHFSDLQTWSHNINPRSRCLMPHEIISFPLASDFTSYLLSNNTALPSDPRLHPRSTLGGGGGGDDADATTWVTNARKEFEDDTVMERQAGWDERVKTVFPSHHHRSLPAADGAEKKNDKNDNTTNDAPPASLPVVPSFSDIVDQVEVAIARLKATRLSLEDGVCVTGAFSTADDAGWALESNTPLCSTVADVFTTLTMSTKFGRDLRMQVSSAKRKNNESGKVYFALRPWLNINPATEFRVFVEAGKILGACQRCMDQLFPHLFPFAVPATAAAPSSGGEEEGEDMSTDKQGDEEDSLDVDGALRWAREMETLVMDNVVFPIVSASSSSSSSSSWTSAPSLVIDVVHEGPEEVGRLPMYILGVRALESLEPLVMSRHEEISSNKNNNDLVNNEDDDQHDQQEQQRGRRELVEVLSRRLVAPKQEEVFRIFGNAAALRDWSSAAKEMFRCRDKNLVKESLDNNNNNNNSNVGGKENETTHKLLLIRIATSADELCMDARAAHRGAAPLEFTCPEAFNSVMAQLAVGGQQQQHQQQQQVPRQIIEQIMAARSTVHGADDMKN